LGILAAGLVVASGSFAAAQEVNTERYKPAVTPFFPAESLARLQVSDQPRYYLDTIDQLNRSTSDLTRSAPGLAKNNYVVKAFSIQNAEAIEIQSYLLRTLAYEGGVAEVMGADGVAGGQVLIVTAPDFMIPGIVELVALSDKTGFKYFDATGKDFGGGSGARTYVGKHRTASELKSILAGTELGNIGVFLYPPFADDSTNSLYVVDNPSDIADNFLALEAFDKPPLQVDLEVTIYEINDGDRAKLGLDWDAWKRFTAGAFEYSGSNDQTFFASDTDSFSTLLTLDARALASFLNYTVQTGTTNVVTATKITMVNSEDVPGGLSGGNRGTSTGVPAVIESVVSYPFTVLQEDVGGTNSTNARNEVFDSAFEGVRVEILPFIGTESLTLTINAVVNSLVGFSAGNDIPIIASRSVNSVVNLTNGTPIIIGGLDRTNNVESRVGIPLLKDIPVIQYLFSKKVKDTTKSKVIISLKPTIKSGTVAELPNLAME